MEVVFKDVTAHKLGFSMVKNKPYKLVLDFNDWVVATCQVAKLKIAGKEQNSRYPISDVEIRHGDSPNTAKVILNYSTKTPKRRHFQFGVPGDRDRFCNFIRASQRCGPQALEAFRSLDVQQENCISYSTVQSMLGRRKSSLLLNGEPENISFPEFLMVFYQNLTIDADNPSAGQGDVFRQVAIKMIHQDKTYKVPLHDVSMLGGETEVLRHPEVVGSCSVMNLEGLTGELVLTNYRLIFDPYNRNPKTMNSVQVPLALINKVDFVPDGVFPTLMIHCKDFRMLAFSFSVSEKTLNEFRDKLVELSLPNDETLSFAFTHQLKVGEPAVDGWKLYNQMDEFKRLNMVHDPNFRIYDNVDFKLCDTYPRYLVFPSQVSVDELLQTAAFRSKGRVPVITWKHAGTHATLSRCSQPITGMLRKRNKADEKLIDCIREINPTNSDMLSFMDARPLKAAVGNAIMGKGFENMANYGQADLQFLGIDNIHVIRGSHERLHEVMYGGDEDDDNFLSRLENSQWLAYVRLILGSSVRIVEEMEDQGRSVIVHCSDGWDRTSQLCALACLMMDPYFRTLNGFAILIEKEWLSYGHKFGQRFGHTNPNFEDEQRAPIFIQFIDCVYQLIKQFPTAFEFNEDLLLEVVDACRDCRFGTFLFNSEKLRRYDNTCLSSTPSLWTYTCSMPARLKFVNPYFNAACTDRLTPSCDIRDICIWRSLHRRWTLPLPTSLSPERSALLSRFLYAFLHAEIGKKSGSNISWAKLQNRCTAQLKPIFGLDAILQEFQAIKSFRQGMEALIDPTEEFQSDSDAHDKENEFFSSSEIAIPMTQLPPLKTEFEWEPMEQIHPLDRY